MEFAESGRPVDNDGTATVVLPPAGAADEPVITITGLTKTFEHRTALAGVDLSIERGGSVAVSGPDREGRTTLMQLLATLIRPTSGTIVIGGLDAVTEVYRVRRLLAYAGPTRILPNRLRVDEYLRFVAGARHQPSAAAEHRGRSRRPGPARADRGARR